MKRKVRGKQGEMRAAIKLLLKAEIPVREIAERLDTTTQNVYRHKAAIVNDDD